MQNRRDILKVAGVAGAVALHPAFRAALAPIIAAASEASAIGAVAVGQGFAIAPVAFNEVKLTDRFWAPRLVTQQQVLLPFALNKVEPAVENLRRTAAFRRGEDVKLLGLLRFVSSDLFKVMEGAAYLLKVRRDPALEAHMDSIIDVIGEAQMPDGYLFEFHIAPPPENQKIDGVNGIGKRPYSAEVHSHETYNMGHMYEAAIAYYQSTGKDKWLKIAEKNAQHINRVFFVGDPAYNDGKPVNQAPGHQEIELALVKLYRVTGNRLYLDMAKRFLDIRGATYRPEGKGPMAPTYAQQHAPVAQQDKAVGHAVRAAYLYAGMADVGALADTDEYEAALGAIWHDIVDKKMHITGGLGAVHGIEGFGDAYDLPNAKAYNETCAAVANVMFNMRMFLMSGDAKFVDVAEVALYNNVLAGTNLAGNRFFYVNPLESDGVTKFNSGTAERVEWFRTACCPSNLARLIPQVSGLMYAHESDTLFVTLYGSNTSEIALAGGKVAITQNADYPFDGRIALRLDPAKPMRFALKLRIPTWAQGKQFVPGALYRYAEPGQSAAWRIRVNGRPVKAVVDKGFATVERQWRVGDRVTLDLPLEMHFSKALPQVEANRGRAAITRGPLVFCAEGADNGGAVQRLRIDAVRDPSAKIARFADGPLAGIARIETRASTEADGGNSKTALVLIPYYAWNNRGPDSMAVWLPEKHA